MKNEVFKEIMAIALDPEVTAFLSGELGDEHVVERGATRLLLGHDKYLHVAVEVGGKPVSGMEVQAVLYKGDDRFLSSAHGDPLPATFYWYTEWPMPDWCLVFAPAKLFTANPDDD